MTLRQRQYLKGGKEAIMAKVVPMMRKGLILFRQFGYGDAKLNGNPKFDWDSKRQDLLIEFPMMYTTLVSKGRDDWTEGPDAEGTFNVYLYPSSDTELELEMVYQNEHGDGMKSDKGKMEVKSTLAVNPQTFNWNILKKELTQLKNKLGGVEAVWAD